MLINLSPVRSDEQLTLAVSGDTLLINDVPFDFSPLPEGAILPVAAIGSSWITEDVKRVDGVIQVTVMLPHADDASEAARFPQPITAADGPVELPK